MEIQTKATFLTAESKPYKMEGNEGVSHRVRLAVDSEIYVFKSTEDQVRKLNENFKKGDVGDLSARVNSKKENLSLEIVSFE